MFVSRGHALLISIGAALLGGCLLTALPSDRLGPDEPRVSIEPRPVRVARAARPRTDIRLDVKQVLIPVSVTDRWDRPVTNLLPEDFRLFEDSVEQKIVSCYREDAPVSAGLLFDSSSSMHKKLEYSRAAVERFFTSSRPGDEFFLVRFSDRPELMTGFTGDSDTILRRLSFVRAQGWTALYDAIYLGVHQLKRASNSRRALFILSDGGDNNSRYTASEIRDLVLESDVRVYAIGLFERSKFLAKLTAQSGGGMCWVRDLDDLPAAVDKLAAELRNEYVLGYSPTAPQADGRYRKVRVELTHPAPLRLSWRRAYYAPEE